MSEPQQCQVVAIFTPKPEFAAEIKVLLAEVAVEVRTENGCLFYDLFQEIDGHLWFIEAWSSRELWQQHNDAPSVAKITAGIEGKLLEPVSVHEMYAV
jgi:quinol monooxygenase YgiN